MTKRPIVAIVVIAALLLASVGYSQNGVPGTLVQQSPTHLDTCTPINAAVASGSQTTLTIAAPPSGQYVYLTEIDYQYVVGTALGGVLAPTNTTTTNLGGLKFGITMPVTANTNYNNSFVYQTALKAAAPSTAVTIVSPAGTANLTYNINACYYYAP